MPTSSTPIRKRAGQLRHQITLQEGVQVEDELKGSVETWPAFGTDWAAIDATAFAPTETEAVTTYQVTLRYRSDVETKFLSGTQLRVYDAASGLTLKVLTLVNAELRNRDLVLHCGRVVGE